MPSFYQENIFENIVCKMSVFLSWPHCVKTSRWVLSVVGDLSTIASEICRLLAAYFGCLLPINALSRKTLFNTMDSERNYRNNAFCYFLLALNLLMLVLNGWVDKCVYKNTQSHQPVFNTLAPWQNVNDIFEFMLLKKKMCTSLSLFSARMQAYV